MLKNWKKFTAEKKFIFFFIKNRNLLIPFLGLHKGRPCYRRSLQSSEENIQHFKTWNFFTTRIRNPDCRNLSFDITGKICGISGKIGDFRRRSFIFRLYENVEANFTKLNICSGTRLEFCFFVLTFPPIYVPLSSRYRILCLQAVPFIIASFVDP